MIKDKPSPYVGCQVTIRGSESQAKHSKGMCGYVIDVEEARNVAIVSYGNDARLGKFPLRSLICVYVFPVTFHTFEMTTCCRENYQCLDGSVSLTPDEVTGVMENHT